MEGRPWLTWLFARLAKSETLKFFRVDWPIAGNDDMRLFVSVVLDIKARLHDRYGIQTFVLSIYPGELRYVEKIKPLLEAAGVIVFDFSRVDIYRLLGNRTTIYGNSHPSEVAHKLYADLISHEMRERGLVTH